MSANTISSTERLVTGAESLKSASHEFYEICGQVDESYYERGVDIDNVPQAEYWLSVATAANDKVRDNYATIESSDTEFAHGAALEMLCATPYYLIAQQRLNQARNNHPSSSLNKDQKDDALWYASYYNGLLRSFGAQHPDITRHDINEATTDIIRKSGITKYPEGMRRLMADTIRGAQNEILTSQVLSDFGEVRFATIKEDMRGVDIVLTPHGSNKSVFIDTKTSPAAILNIDKGKRKPAEHEPIWTKNRGKIILCPNFDEAIIGGHFTLNSLQASRLADKLAPTVQEILHSK